MTHLGDLAHALVDGELDGVRREVVLAHLARCATCRGEVAGVRALKSRLVALPKAAAPPALVARLIAIGSERSPSGLPAPPSGLARPSFDVATAAPAAVPRRRRRRGPASRSARASPPSGPPRVRPRRLAAAGGVVLAVMAFGAAFAAGEAAPSAPHVVPQVDRYAVEYAATVGEASLGAGPVVAVSVAQPGAPFVGDWPRVP